MGGSNQPLLFIPILSGLGLMRDWNRTVGAHAIVDWTADKIDGLAPDGASAAAGRKLASAANWVTRGAVESALWGECKGSGKNPYQVRVDFNGPAYKCSCPSRKIPCKHCLGLLYLFAASGGTFSRDDAPEWLTAWLGDRQVRETKKAERVEKKAPEDTPEARKKRTAKRLDKSLEGLEELSLRLCDLVREGLGAAPGKPYAFWDQAARRLMDAQAPGAARRVRQLAAIPASGEGWPERMLAGMGELCLLVSAARNFATLSEETQADFAAALGWTEKKESILALSGQRDTWSVLAVTVEDDEETRLRVRHAWLWGHESRRHALLLDFAAGKQPFEATWFPGTAFEAELVYYPASYPLRAVVKGTPVSSNFAMPKGFSDIDAALASRADALAKNAWIGPFPMVVDGLTPWHTSGQWVIIDRLGKSVPLMGEADALWALLAETGGQPTTLFGLWEEGAFRIFSDVWAGSEVVVPRKTASPRLRQLARSMMLRSDASGHPMPVTEGALGDALSKLNGDSPSWRSLQGAALVAAHDSAGWQPPIWSGESPEPAPVDARLALGPVALNTLSQLIAGRKSALWPEFAALAASSDRRVPSRFHHVLLDLAQREKSLRPDLLQLLGARGAWLAKFCEDWKLPELTETEPESETIWENGALAERLAWIARLRQRDPAAARTMLSKDFKKEPAPSRAAFLEVLSESLSMQDEEFLETALDDKSARVSGAAAMLLRHLPESRLVGRALEMIRGSIVLEKSLLRTRLSVTLPEELTPAMKRDGIEDKPANGVGLGNKASMLSQIVASVPLGFWTTHFQRDLPELLKLAGKTDFELALIHGWQEAALRERSAEWLEVLIDRAYSKDSVYRRGQLIQALPPEALMRHLATTLTAGASKNPLSPSVFAHEAAKLPRPWPPDFGRAVLQWMRRHADGDDATAAGYGRAGMEQLAAMLPPSVLAEAQDPWPQSGLAWESLVRNPDNFYELLKLRYQLNREFGE